MPRLRLRRAPAGSRATGCTASPGTSRVTACGRGGQSRCWSMTSAKVISTYRSSWVDRVPDHVGRPLQLALEDPSVGPETPSEPRRRPRIIWPAHPPRTLSSSGRPTHAPAGASAAAATEPVRISAQTTVAFASLIAELPPERRPGRTIYQAARHSERRAGPLESPRKAVRPPPSTI